MPWHPGLRDRLRKHGWPVREPRAGAGECGVRRVCRARVPVRRVDAGESGEDWKGGAAVGLWAATAAAKAGKRLAGGEA